MLTLVPSQDPFGLRCYLMVSVIEVAISPLVVNHPPGAAFVYLSVMRLLKQMIANSGQDDQTRLIKQLLRRLNIYPFVLVVCWFWPSVRHGGVGSVFLGVLGHS